MIVCRDILRSFPSLINCCYIDWFHPWSTEALTCVAEKILDDDAIAIPPVQLSALVLCCVKLHDSASVLREQFKVEQGREVHITSSLFIRLVNAFVAMLAQVIVVFPCTY